MVKTISEFEKNVPFEKRLDEATKIMEKYPDRIPVIVERGDNKTPEIGDKKKFLVPGDMTFSQLMYIIRKRIKLSPDQAIFFMINDIMPPSYSIMSQIYEEHKSSCKFLIVRYCAENTFGMQISEPNVTFTTIRDPENIFGRQSRLDLTKRNLDVEEISRGQFNVWKRRTKLNQGDLPKTTYPKLKNNSGDRLYPNKSEGCKELSGPFYNYSFYPETSIFRHQYRNLDNDPNYKSSATKYFRQTTNSFDK